MYICRFYLERFIEEGLHPFRQASDQAKRIPQHIQTQDQNIHLLEELQEKENNDINDAPLLRKDVRMMTITCSL